MSFGENIIGNRKIIEMLQKGYDAGKMSHAYLFEGPDHIGKMTVALDFCQLVLDENTKDIEKNPDLIILSPEEDKEKITIDQIREFEKKINFYPYLSKYKIAIIQKADMMTREASNAILKTLEEPSSTTILILLTSNSGNLLETIKSRCQIMKFLAVKKGLLENFLSATTEDKSERDRIIEMSGYKPGKIVELINKQNGIKEISDVLDCLSEILGKNDFARLNEADFVSKKESKEIVSLLNYYSLYFRKQMLDQFDDKEGIDKNKILKIKTNIDLLDSTKNNILNISINIKLALENLFLQI